MRLVQTGDGAALMILDEEPGGGRKDRLGSGKSDPQSADQWQGDHGPRGSLRLGTLEPKG